MPVQPRIVAALLYSNVKAGRKLRHVNLFGVSRRSKNMKSEGATNFIRYSRKIGRHSPDLEMVQIERRGEPVRMR